MAVSRWPLAVSHWPSAISRWPLARKRGLQSLKTGALFSTADGQRLPANGQLRRHPFPPQRLHVGRVAQLLEGALADLADPLPGHPEERADLLQGERLGAFLEPVVEREDLALPRGEVPLEQPVDELAPEPRVGELLDVAAGHPGHPLA